MTITIMKTSTGLILKSANKGFEVFRKKYAKTIPAGMLFMVMSDIANYANNTLKEECLFEVE